MKKIVLGTDPYGLEVKISRDSTFSAALVNSAGPYPAGASIELRMGTYIWEAVIVTDRATFNATTTQVNQIINSKTRTAKLFYIDGGVPVCWASGLVEASG